MKLLEKNWVQADALQGGSEHAAAQEICFQNLCGAQRMGWSYASKLPLPWETEASKGGTAS